MKTPSLGSVLSVVVSLFVFPSVACAHAGAPHAHGLWDGLTHPMLGLDHQLAMIAVGIWAAHLGGRSQWYVPLSFLLAMTIGGVLGANGAHVPFVEAGIAASVLVVGVLIAAAVRLPLTGSMVLIGLFALFHGCAHGLEMPSGASGVAYGFGFVLSTAILHAVGLCLGWIAERYETVAWLRYVGAAIVVAGLTMPFV